MAWHGARQIIVCSRSGLSDEASQKTIANYSAYGCDIVGAKGDVADMAFLRKMFREAAPALAGVVQGAMIFRVSLAKPPCLSKIFKIGLHSNIGQAI